MFLDTDYQTFIGLSRYARWLEAVGRRETFDETIKRYFDYVESFIKEKYDYDIYSMRGDLTEAVKSLKVMPSMRAMMTAGPALDRCHVGGYNCSYIPVDNIRSFDECMYILMCGTGVGFSVEREGIEKLPVVPDTFQQATSLIVVEDSKAGWCDALRQILTGLYAGYIFNWDVSKIRPAGARLMTFGGRASGPEPLEDLFKFVINVFTGAAGRHLYPLEAHDIMCKIGEIVVVGGVRRSALISLSNLSDTSMRLAKSGDWWATNGQRTLANNSAVYKNRPSMEVFMNEWHSLYESKSGERGLFNRQAAVKQVERNGRRLTHIKDKPIAFGTNPCSEIILRPYQFCNLSEVVVRSDDTLATLKDKVRQATILGTLQSCMTDFKYLRSVWKKNTEEERLLGVSLTGIMDCKLTNGFEGFEALGKVLDILREVAIETNRELAVGLGIPQSTAITCVKPSGTVSQLVDSASGIHPRHSPYYIRTVRADNKDPLTKFMSEYGIPNEPDVTKPLSTTVFSFPVKAPEGALCRDDVTAITHLQLWKVYARHWCEHKPSITVSVKEDEWFDVGAWVYRNFDEVSGISFLPYDGGSYRQAPYQECTKDEYDTLLAQSPDSVNWLEFLSEYEKEDTTTGSQELACTAGVCEVVDIVSN